MFYLIPILAIIMGFIFAISYKVFRKNALFSIGIGSAVSACVFSIKVCSIQLGNLVLGFDSVIYTVFVFCVIVACKDYSKKVAYSLLYSSVAGVLISSVYNFFCSWSDSGLTNVLWEFVSYLASAIGTVVAIIIAILVFEKLRDYVSRYISIGVAVLIASIINSAIYLGIMTIIDGGMTNFVDVLMGSYVVKICTLILFLTIYSVYSHFFIECRVKKRKNKRKICIKDNKIQVKENKRVENSLQTEFSDQKIEKEQELSKVHSIENENNKIQHVDEIGQNDTNKSVKPKRVKKIK